MNCSICGKPVRPAGGSAEGEFCSCRSRQYRPPLGVRIARVVPVVLIVLLVIAGISYLAIPPPASGPAKSSQTWFEKVGAAAVQLVRGRPRPSVIDYFNSGLENWVSATVHPAGAPTRFGSGEWSCDSRGAEPGAMRIWKDSFDLGDCDIEFRARINVRAVGLAFRATDAGTFYGLKITTAWRGQGAAAHVEHFVQLNGKTYSEAATPLHLPMDEGTEFNVLLRLRGSRFTTTVDGTDVDVWTDDRLQGGGIGFFNEAGTSSTIRWVRFTERDSFLGRAAGLFSFVCLPRP